MPSGQLEILQQIGNDGLIVIIRGQFEQDELLSLGESLAEAGVTVMEVTLNTPGALAAIGRLQANLGSGIHVGAGSVRTAAQWQAAYDAGAQFTVAPNFDPATVAAAVSRGLLHIPGVFTASEAEAAHAAGSALLKLFPANMGGPSYLKALCAPLDDLNFVAVGGVSAANAGEFRRAGAYALGVGSSLFKGGSATSGDISSRVNQLRRAWQEGS